MIIRVATVQAQPKLNLSQVHCVSVQSSRCVREVVSGLVVSCNSQIMERIGIISHKRKTLLVNGDLKHSFVHKGYKPAVSKKTVVEDETSLGSLLSHGQEYSWALNVVDILRQLQVDVVLVKGRICALLSDMLSKENAIVLTSVPFRVLQIIHQNHRVTMLTYIQDATTNDICLLSYQPIEEHWMDHDGDSHCLRISDLPQIQTIVLQLPSTHSCHVEEEKVWRCLHRLANALQDGMVLPGSGVTEMWCEGRVRTMSGDWPVGSSPQTDLILQALADVFHDYHSFTRLNLKSAGEEHKEHQQHASFLQKPNESCRIGNDAEEDEKLRLLLSCSHDYFSDSFRTGNKNMKENKANSRSSITKRSVDGHKSNSCATEVKQQTNHLNRVFHYDSFQSKVSSWSSAIDTVKVLLSLDSLVVTGVSSTDWSEDVLL